MTEVIVGVRPVKDGYAAEGLAHADVSMQTHWVMINGALIPNVIATSCDTSDGPVRVRIEFFAASYQLVDASTQQFYTSLASDK